MPTETTTEINETELKALVNRLSEGEPKWLADKRARAAEAFVALPLPDRRRTPLKNRKLDRIPVFEPPTDETPPATRAPKTDGALLQFAHDRVEIAELPVALKDAGVLLLDMRDALALAPELVREHLGRAVADDLDKFQALNAAYWQNGAFLYVPPRVRVDVAVTIAHYTRPERRGFFPRTLIVADRESKVTVVENFFTAPSSDPSPEKTLASGCVEIIVGEGAQVEYGSMQSLSPQTEFFLRRGMRVARDGKLRLSIGEFGSGLTVSEHVAYLDAPGAEARSTTVFFGGSGQHQDYTAKAVHEAPYTTSDTVAKGVMKGRGRSVFTGVTQIKKGAHQSNGRQKEQTLMLSDRSRADAIPSLLIDEHDVFAAHSASAGPVDQNTLYYLMSRGLDETEAIRTVVRGFLAPVVDSISVQTIRALVWDAVERKIVE